MWWRAHTHVTDDEETGQDGTGQDRSSQQDIIANHQRFLPPQKCFYANWCEDDNSNVIGADWHGNRPTADTREVSVLWIQRFASVLHHHSPQYMRIVERSAQRKICSKSSYLPLSL